MSNEIKVGQKYTYPKDGDVFTVTEINGCRIKGDWSCENGENCYVDDDFLREECDLHNELVWTRKSDGYQPEIKYESDRHVIYMGSTTDEFHHELWVFKDLYEKRPKKTPASIVEMKRAGNLGQ